MSRGSDRSRGQVVVPDTGHGPGILVLADGPGRDPLAREACARLARHGFVAWAPPLLEGAEDGPSERERQLVDTAIEQLFREHATDGARLGALGFGRGGLLALDAAARGARLAVVVSFDAACCSEALAGISLATLEARVLGVFGEKDPAVEGGRAAALGERLRAEGVACELCVLPGAKPGFFDPILADCYDAVAARAGWDRALATLRAEL